METWDKEASCGCGLVGSQSLAGGPACPGWQVIKVHILDTPLTPHSALPEQSQGWGDVQLNTLPSA